MEYSQNETVFVVLACHTWRFWTPNRPISIHCFIRQQSRNTVIGHAVGVVAGYLSLVVTGLTNAGPALSLGLTSGLMVLLKSPHPPAGATTLIISLGILTHPWQLLLLMIAVVLLTLQALAINCLAGIPYPLWNPPKEATSGGKEQGSAKKKE